MPTLTDQAGISMQMASFVPVRVRPGARIEILNIKTGKASVWHVTRAYLCEYQVQFKFEE